MCNWQIKNYTDKKNLQNNKKKDNQAKSLVNPKVQNCRHKTLH